MSDSANTKSSRRRRGKSVPSEVVVHGQDAPSSPSFPYLEARLAGLVGLNIRKFAKMRESLERGVDWEKRGVGFWWSEGGVKTALQALGVPLDVVFPKKGAAPLDAAKNAPPPEAGPWMPATVVNTNLTNPYLILATVEGVVEKVQVGRDWREWFKPGMAIEIQKSPAGLWRTRKPRAVGRFA